ALLGFTPDVHFDEHRQPPALGLGAAPELDREPLGIHGLDQAGQRHGLRRLVALQMADEVPAEARQVAQRSGLRGELLDVVLPEVTLAFGERRADRLHGLLLGDRDQPDRVRRAPGLRARGPQALTNLPQALGDLGHRVPATPHALRARRTTSLALSRARSAPCFRIRSSRSGSPASAARRARASAKYRSDTSASACFTSPYMSPP